MARRAASKAVLAALQAQREEDRTLQHKLARDGLLKPPPNPPKRTTKKSIINTASKGDEEKQAHGTPWEFIHALAWRFGCRVDFDLAADEQNSKAGAFYFSETNDALLQDWSNLRVRDTLQTVGTTVTYGEWRDAKLAYINPPFARIDPWAERLSNCRWLKRWTVGLWPASMSCKWWHRQLVGKVQIDSIPRIQFIGQAHLYPKDLALAVAGFGVVGAGYWDWRVDYHAWCTARGQTGPTMIAGKEYLARANAGAVFPDLMHTPSPFYVPVEVTQ